jgi:hypothetical protein
VIDPGRNARLCIHPHYAHRPDPVHFDDRDQADLYQDAVYRFARDVSVARGFRRIIDVGCGSAFKLMKYFGGYDTVGFEIEPALSYLKQTYPIRVWRSADDVEAFFGDLVICSDVIEHLVDPTSLLRTIKASPLQMVILSTPALEILAERGQSPRLGPPDNASHVNEWTTREFGDFVAMHLKVVEHIVVDATQGTQLVLAERK